MRMEIMYSTHKDLCYEVNSIRVDKNGDRVSEDMESKLMIITEKVEARNISLEQKARPQNC